MPRIGGGQARVVDLRHRRAMNVWAAGYRAAMPEGSPSALESAMDLLGLHGGVTIREARSAYRRALLRSHPDSAGIAPERSDPATGHRSQRVVEAWNEVLAAFGGTDRLDLPGPSGTPMPTGAPDAVPADGPGAVVDIIANDGLWIGWSKHEAAALVVEALHSLGDVSYADEASGLFEAIIEFVDGPMCSLVCTLQGRAAAGASGSEGRAGTEIMVAVEAISVPDAPQVPPIEGVTRLLADTIRSATV